ncbi:MAG: NAD-dependent succinate-semialdehyde dehydrogenase [Bythopirellula sp.]|nr:NAD-dependent succinate-semialdehyde dehydrogenase [Bythopirellula sp.]
MTRLDKLFIDGAWVPAQTGRKRAVINPGDEVEVTEVAFGDGGDCRAAIAAAERAFPGWSRSTPYERGKILAAAASEFRIRQDELAQLTVSECSKPLAEARAEWGVVADLFEWFAEEGKRVYGRVIPARTPGRRISVLKQPLGVVGVITAWNFPAYNPARASAAALAAGCTVVCRPSELTPLSALAMADVLASCGLPRGVFNVVNGEPASIGEEMLSNPICRKISFTGSTEVGRILMRGAAATITRLSLELGGNAPVLVFADADCELAVQTAVAARFRNAGQVCIAPQRFLVHENVFEHFLAGAIKQTTALRLGPGSDPQSNVGPLINRSQLDRVEKLVEEARQGGAIIHTGGKRPPTMPRGFFYEPTVVSHVDKESPLWREEIFGPVLTINSFRTFEEALKQANATPHGLAAYLWTRDLATAVRASEQLEFGMVAVNSCTPHATEAPFPGWKQSGLGSESGPEGLMDYLETKVVSLSGM